MRPGTLQALRVRTRLPGHHSLFQSANWGGLGQIRAFLPNAPSKEQDGFQTGSHAVAQTSCVPLR